MPKVLDFYSVIYVVFFSNKQSLKNKRHNLLFIEKYEKPCKLAKYQFTY
jgi:hypothetical protein